MKIICLFGFWLLPATFNSVLFSQSSSGDSLIVAQIWRPFCSAYASCDTAAFMALHHPAAKRVIRDNDLILNKQEYGQSFGKSCNYLYESQSQRTLELRFTQSIIDGANAFQEGIYKSQYADSRGLATNYYGKFHVLLTFENGRWLITMDADSSTDVHPIDFENLKPIK